MVLIFVYVFKARRKSISSDEILRILFYFNEEFSFAKNVHEIFSIKLIYHILISVGLLGVSVVICVVMAFTGAAKDIPWVLGIMGIASFVVLFFLSLAYKKSPEDQQRDKDFFLSLVELSEENPKQFYREFKRLLGPGTRYIILLFVLIFLSIEGIIALGLKHRSTLVVLV